MKRLLRTLLAVSLVAAALSGGTAAAARQPDDARSEHQRTVDFWTVDRVRRAVPRDFVFDQASGRFIPTARGGNPGPPGGGGGGNGGGGGGSTAVTGAHWTTGTKVLATTGKVLFELSGTLWVCSASVVDDTAPDVSLILTAAHCVYENEGAGEFASNWMFVPAYDTLPVNLDGGGTFCAGTTYGCWTADSLVVHEGFASAGGFNGTAILHDFAFAVVGEGGHGNGTTGLAETVLGSHDITFTSVSKGTDAYTFGYPHAESFNRELTYCAGGANFDNRLFKLTYKLKCSMTGGASGGPWYASFDTTLGTGTAASVNSYRYSGGDALYGPKFDSNTRAVYDAAMVAANSCIAPTTCPTG